jgi:serine protease AprX
MRRPHARWLWVRGAVAVAAGLSFSLLALRSLGASLRQPAGITAPSNPRLSAELRDQLSAADARANVGVIVRYKAGREPAAGAAPGRIERRLRYDRSIAVHLTPPQIRQLLAGDAVESIEPDTVYHMMRDTAEQFIGSTQASRDFGLSGDGDGNPLVYTAKDHTIAIVDTGIDGEHQDFAGGKIIAWTDLVNQQPAPYDDEGHGTHVASIAAGAVNPDGVGGVAPGAALVGVKVLDDKGVGTAGNIAAGVEWCITNKDQYGIEALNLSLGSDRPSSGTDLLSRTVNRAVDAGIVVTVAAGNAGPRQRTIGSPGAASGALTVGSIADPGAGGCFLDSYSSRGPTADERVKPDLCAPGDRILAARAHSGSGYVSFSGTSMATPFVAGVAALLRQVNPALTAAEVKTALKETAVHYGVGGENDDFGAGRLDAYAALARAMGKPGAPPAVPGHLSAVGHLQAAGDSNTWDLTLTNAGFPVAVTLLGQSASGGLKLQVFNAAGRLMTSATARSREASVSFRPSVTGRYQLVVLSSTDAADYSLDVSAGADSPLQEEP